MLHLSSASQNWLATDFIMTEKFTKCLSRRFKMVVRDEHKFIPEVLLSKLLKKEHDGRLHPAV